MGKPGSGKMTRDMKIGRGMACHAPTKAAPDRPRGIGMFKCPDSGAPIDINVCMVNKTRMRRGCVECTEVGI